MTIIINLQMGVPRLYRYLQRKFPNIWFQTNVDMLMSNALEHFRSRHNLKNFHVDNLYLDMNGIIHNSSQWVFCYGNFSTRQRDTIPVISEVYTSVTENVDHLLKTVRPRQLLYMAVDGVCPRAKQQHQRQRRYSAMISTDTVADINPRLRSRIDSRHEIDGTIKKDTCRKPSEKTPKTTYGHLFNSANISPSTSFMQELDQHLKQYVKISEKDVLSKIKTIYSSHEFVGEGEHKLMEYIRKNLSILKTKTHGIYGLDADFFMLSLASRCPNIFLIREDMADMSMHYVSIDLLRQNLIELLSTEKHPDPDTIIDDFILLCIMVGNDFLRPIASFEDLPVAMDIILETYINFSAPLTKNRIIIPENIRNFLQYLRNHQQTLLQKIILNSGKHIEPDPALVNSTCARMDSGVFREYVNVDQWEREYYNDRFSIEKIDDTESIKKRYDICRSYYTGLDWICRYYFTGCPDWKWCYPYHYSPILSDLCDHKYRPHIFKVGKAVQPIVQLLAILPPTANELIPTKYRHLMTDINSPLAKYYPNTVIMSLKGCTVPWNGTLHLPFINYDDIEKAVAEIDY